jgi:thioesterase domain-containing protein
VVPLSPSRAGTPLVLVHPVGGSVLPYMALLQEVGPHPCIGLEAPRLYGEPMATTLQGLAADYVAALRTLHETGPYALLGWSLGGAIAFEMARLLRAAGEEPVFLGLVDTDPDWLLGNAPTTSELAVAFATDLALMQGEELSAQVREDVAAVAAPSAVVAAVCRGGLVPAVVADELLPRLEAFATLARAFAAYQPAPAGLPATLFSGREGAERQEAAWRAVTGDRVTQHLVDADHYGILRAPHIGSIAKRVRAALVQSTP